VQPLDGGPDVVQQPAGRTVDDHGTVVRLGVRVLVGRVRVRVLGLRVLVVGRLGFLGFLEFVEFVGFLGLRLVRLVRLVRRLLVIELVVRVVLRQPLRRHVHQLGRTAGRAARREQLGGDRPVQGRHGQPLEAQVGDLLGPRRRGRVALTAAIVESGRSSRPCRSCRGLPTTIGRLVVLNHNDKARGTAQKTATRRS
jgi:hypothetical protein